MALPGHSLIICNPVGEERASQMVLVIKNLPTNERDTRDVGSIPGSGRSPGVQRAPTPVFFSGEFHGQRSLVGYSPRAHKVFRQA